MGIFGNDKKEEKKADAPKVEEKKAPKAVTETGVVPANILVKPHLTEKALLAGVKNVYVFQVFARAAKRDVAKAVEEAFNVTVTKVNMAKTPGKKGSRRTKGKAGSKSGIKKAYVTLKDGDKLQLI